MTAMLSMLLLGAVSWVFRIAFVTLLPAERLPARLQTGLEYLAPAVLAAIVAVELSSLVRDAEPLDAMVLLAAGSVIGLVAFHTRNLSLACALGVGVVLIVDYLPW
ncbi:AzlD domain-containing protein [Kribbella sp. NPDC023972]|uniref:AzlD domain-containing protein n=1 Tax=Kribbella sp. NPDC023972 TaxID=3154795 RepID=UPI0033D7EC2F